MEDGEDGEDEDDYSSGKTFIWWHKLSIDKSWNSQRSDSLWRFACGDVFTGPLRLVRNKAGASAASLDINGTKVQDIWDFRRTFWAKTNPNENKLGCGTLSQWIMAESKFSRNIDEASFNNSTV